jgi:CHAD domain-containing protein
MNSDPPDRVGPLLRQRIKTLFKHLPKALAGGEEDLHQMRVAGRRLRVALPLLARKPEGKRVRRSLRLLRSLTRAGGFSRDLDVGVALAEEETAKGSPTTERRLLLRRLKGARARARSRMAEALLDIEIARLRRDLRVLARRSDGFFAVLSRLRERRDEDGSEALALVAALGDRFDPVALHRLRRIVRRLRYTAEISGVLKDQPTPAAEDLRNLQDVLGSLHDTFVLAEWFGRQATACSGRGEAALAAEASLLRALFQAKTEETHRAFLALPPPDVIDRALLAMGQSRPAA